MTYYRLVVAGRGLIVLKKSGGEGVVHPEYKGDIVSSIVFIRYIFVSSTSEGQSPMGEPNMVVFVGLTTQASRIKSP